MHRFEAALRLLDEHCRVYQYLVKRTVAPFVAATCAQPVANEAIQRARRVPERPTTGPVRARAVPGPPLRGAHTSYARSTSSSAICGSRRAQASGTGCRPTRRCSFSTTELDRAVGDASPQGGGVRGPAQRLRARPRSRRREAFRFFRELVNYDPAVIDAAAARARHAPGLLRRGFGRRVPPRPPAGRSIGTSRCCR